MEMRTVDDRHGVTKGENVSGGRCPEAAAKTRPGSHTRYLRSRSPGI